MAKIKKNNLLHFTYSLCVCLLVYVFEHMPAKAHTWKSEGNL